MNTNHHQQPCTADAGAAQAASRPACRQIKLALDVHAATIVVVRMVDGAKPQPPGFPCSNSLRRLTLPTETKPQTQPTVTTELEPLHRRKLLWRRGPERTAAGG
jgi:hypothetical protein